MNLTANAEQAARKVVNRYVRAGLINRQTGNMVLAFAVPLCTTTLADLRRSGMSPEEITAQFQAKRTEATQPVAVVAAEIFLAVWAGVQVDYATFANARRNPDQTSITQS